MTNGRRGGEAPFGPVDPDDAADPDARSNPFDPRREDAIRPRRPDRDDAPLPGSVAPPGFGAAPSTGGSGRNEHAVAPSGPAGGRDSAPPPTDEVIPPRSLTPGRRDPAAPRPQDRHRPQPAGDQPSVPWRERLDRDELTGRAKRVGGPLGLAALLVWKVGRIALVALGKVAILFKIPVLGSVLSGLVSIGAYAVFFGWGFAIGLVASLLVHELGHVAQLRREGMPIRAMNFVPFLGAYVLSDGARSDAQQARVSIAGPVAGTLLALAFLVAADGDPLLTALAYTGFFLNLFNLLPVPPLDGAGVGRLFTAGWWAAIGGALAVMALVSGTAFAAMAAAAAALMAYLRRRDGWALDPGDGIDLRHRVRAGVLYLGVVATCAFGMAATFRDRTDDLVQTYGTGDAPVSAHVMPGSHDPTSEVSAIRP